MSPFPQEFSFTSLPSASPRSLSLLRGLTVITPVNWSPISFWLQTGKNNRGHELWHKLKVTPWASPPSYVDMLSEEYQCSVEVRIPLNQLGVQRINLKFKRKNVILDMPSLCCSHIKSQVCGMKLQLGKKLRHSGDNMFTSVSVYETCVCLCHSFSCCSMFETLSRRMLRGAGSYVGITQFGFSQRNSWRTCL